MGHVEAICIAPVGSASMLALTSVEAIVGRGLRGDRYAAGTGFYSQRPTDPGAREVTLIEAEVLEALKVEHGIQLSIDEHRRNLTVRGVRLDELCGQRFAIGDVVVEGVRDCPPCEHLEQLTGKPVLRPLVDRGGLRARIVVGGTIRLGDSITVASTLRTASA
ncbi:MAG: MOSC domain-containing protein [Chloroflexi bacterium]|nr:MOSC domain-containing protein [Chloroflexota bacterium]